jgi:ATP-dependent DNA ligase
VFTSQTEPSDVRIYQQFLDEGHEGAVAKHVESKYMAGKSHHSWVKVKPVLSGEAVIRGFKPGTPGSDLDGTLGALELEMWDENDQPNGVRCKAGSGLDRDLRDLIWGDQDTFLGRPVEIRYQELGPTGIPRFPRFLRFRDDKQQAPPKAKPAAAPKPRNNAGSPRPRNYKAMGDVKFSQALYELRGGYGDATDRAEHKHTGLANELACAEAEATRRGVT